MMMMMTTFECQRLFFRSIDSVSRARRSYLQWYTKTGIHVSCTHYEIKTVVRITPRLH